MAPTYGYYETGYGKYAFIAFAIYGATVAAYYGLRLFMALLRIFILPGTNVRTHTPSLLTCIELN